MDYKVTDTQLTSIANAIRTKGGTSEQLEFPSGFISAINDISAGIEIVPWATGTDEQIRKMIGAAHLDLIDLSEHSNIGDIRTVPISAFTGPNSVAVSAQNLRLQITSFSDYENCGCKMQVDFKDGLSPYFRWNATDTNEGGYADSEIKTLMPLLVNALPSAFKSMLIEFDCKCSAGSTIETVSGNKLALRSAVEVLGSTASSYAVAGEGSQLPFYQTEANRTKAVGGASTVGWYTRSIRSGSASEVLSIYYNGRKVNTGAPTSTWAIAPFGCL